MAAQTYDGDVIHQTFAMSTVPAVGCVRTVNSFTFGYTLEDYDYQSIGVDSTQVIGAIGTGDPYEVLSFPPGNVTHDDVGFTVIGPDQVDIHLETMRANPAPQSGTLTIAYPEAVSPIEPVLAADARGYVGFTEPYEVTWVVDHASFLVTDTCTSDVEVPPVTPPVVEPPVTPPVVEPPAVTPPTTQPPATVTPVTPVTPVGAVTPPTLAKTGAANGWAGSGAAAALLLGAGATALVLARRRFTRAAN